MKMSAKFGLQLVALAFVLVAVASAQEIAYVELTDVLQRTELQVPPAPEGTHGGWGSAGAGDCGVDARDPRILRTTLTWLNALSYRAGDPIAFEVKIENVGNVAMVLPISPHLSDLQPKDVALRFAYKAMGIEVRVKHRAIPVSRVVLYGNDGHSGTLAKLEPGEWIRVRGHGSVNVLRYSERPSGKNDASEGANADIGLSEVQFIPHPGGSSYDSAGLCPRTETGPDMSVTIVEGPPISTK